jgi:hypothetical protein
VLVAFNNAARLAASSLIAATEVLNGVVHHFNVVVLQQMNGAVLGLEPHLECAVPLHKIAVKTSLVMLFAVLLAKHVSVMYAYETR